MMEAALVLDFNHSYIFIIVYNIQKYLPDELIFLFELRSVIQFLR